MALAHLSRSVGREAPALPQLLDALYDLTPDEFGPQRDKIARRLRSAGHQDDATAIKALARPTQAGWALNRVARTMPHRVTALLESAHRLRATHDGSLDGVGDAELRAAQATWRRTVLDVVGDAQQVLAAAGAPVNAHVADLTALVEGVAGEPDLVDALRLGRLSGQEVDVDVAVPAATVTPLDARRRRVGSRSGGSGSGIDSRRADERDHLGGELSRAQRHLMALRAQRESLALEEAGAEERLLEARRRLDQAEAALRRVTIARHQAERDLQEGQRAVRHVEERVTQLDELMSHPHRTNGAPR